MTSIFIALCFIKTISGSEKCIHGSAIYRTTNDEEEFRELTYKEFIASQEPLITALETNSIVLMLTLVQTIPISTSTDEIEITPDNLPHSPPLLLYSAPVVSNSYFSDNEFGRESFMLSKKLYNGVTGYKNIESEVIIFYTNQTNRYDTLKNNLKKTVLSVIGRFKVGTRKMHHIIAFDIEWNYAGAEQSSNNSNKGKAKAQDDINNHLENIEEKYAKLSSPSRKRRGTNLLPTSSSKTQRTSSEPRNDKPQPDKPQPDNSKNNNPQNDKPQVNNLLNAISQIKNTGSQPQKDVE
ncbi:hypothetical protein C2G38_2266581 [Gigaspora rosea]|uniref:Uncharacterized protein n=1 Tax=Gigaspora rosea TaxID=44941 RepID=A0A397VVG2_9GLOM|nr:hypothetical protein C2G38_2266581 [Gigaspora rosea]